MSEEEPKRPGRPPKAKTVKVKIIEVRKSPVCSGVFLADGTADYQKLVPGEVAELTQEAYDALKDETKELLKVV